MADTQIDRTNGTPTSTKKCTISFWVKDSGAGDGSTRYFWNGFKGSPSNSNWMGIFRNGNGCFGYTNWYGSVDATAAEQMRDPAAWTHVVWACDTSQSTDTDRIKFYLNGQLQTIFNATPSEPSLNTDWGWAESGGVQRWAGSDNNGSWYGGMNGYLADCIYIDGTQYAASDFGETDSTTGIWKPKTISGLTYGNNGSYLQFENAGSMGTDSSGNSNTFTITNPPSNGFQTVDTPSNNFCTMNRLDVGTDNNTVTLSGLRVDAGSTSGQSAEQHTRSTFAVESGKWYWEMRVEANTASMGLLTTDDPISGSYADTPYNIVQYTPSGEIRWRKEGSQVTKTTGIDSYTTGDIVMCALDMDNKRAYFGKNGTWQGDPTPDPASSPSGAGQMAPLLSDYFYQALAFDDSSGSSGRSDWNFGNPIISISSGNADGNGYGNFEYAVPSGYYALCTRNINTYG